MSNFGKWRKDIHEKIPDYERKGLKCRDLSEFPEVEQPFFHCKKNIKPGTCRYDDGQLRYPNTIGIKIAYADWLRMDIDYCIPRLVLEYEATTYLKRLMKQENSFFDEKCFVGVHHHGENGPLPTNTHLHITCSDKRPEDILPFVAKVETIMRQAEEELE